MSQFFNIEDSIYINNDTNVGIGITNPDKKLEVVGDIDTTTDYNINGTQVLSATTLGSAVVNSSLTNVGTLSALTVVGDSSFDGNTTFERVNSTTEGGEIKMMMSDDTNSWHIDSNGASTAQQNLRLFSSASGNKVQIQSDLEVTGDITFSNSTIKGHMIPDTDDAYDIGSAEYKIRDLYVSDNSMWIGDSHKISISGGKMKFRKRKTTTVPAAIAALNGNASGALTSSGKGSLADMKLKHWKQYMRELSSDNSKTVQDVFTDNAEDYIEDSGSYNWLESGTKTFLTSGNVGIGTQDPSALLSLHFDPEASAGLKELLRLSWDDSNYNTLKGDGTKISFHTSNTNNFPGNVEGGYFGVMKANAVEENTECDITIANNDGTNMVERVRILSDGKVGIGDFSSSTPGYKLDVVGDINLTGSIYINDQAQTFASSLTVKESDGSPSISSVDTIEFDQDSGFIVTNPSSGTAKIALGSHWKELYVNGQTTLSPSGQESLELIAGSNVTITTNDSSSPQAVTFASTDTNTQLTQEQVEDYVNGLIVAGSNITKTYDDSAGTLTIASTASGGSSVWSESSNVASYGSGSNGTIKINSNDSVDKIQLTAEGTTGSKINHSSGWCIDYYGGPGNDSGSTGKHRFFTTESSAYSEKMCILSNGNVGIDIASPSEKLHIHDSTSNTGVYMRFTTADTGTASTDGAYIGLDNSEQFYVFNKEDKMMLFGTNNTTRMMIQPSSVGGNILINNSLSLGHNSTPSSVLDISTGSTVGGNTKNCAIKFNNHDAGARFVVWDNGASVNDYAGLGKTSSALDICIPSSDNHIAFKANGSEKMRIQGNGNIGIGLTSIDGVKFQVNGKCRFDTTQTAAPSNATYGGSGCRIILWPGSSSNPPYAFGIDGSTLWASCPSSAVHKWYVGTSWRAKLSGSQFYVNGNIRGTILFVNGSQGIKTPTGSYGTVQCTGGGNNSWEGYSIDGRWVWMSTGDDCGLYNDVDNEWMWKYNRSDNTLRQYVNGEEKFRLDNGGRSNFLKTGNHNDYLTSWTTDNGKGQMAWRWNASGGGSSDYNLDLYMDDNSGSNQKVGYLENSGSGSWRLNDFTGQHRCIPQNNTNSSMFGLIVYSTGKYMNIDNNLKPTIIDSLPICELCTIENDPRVFGVISDEADDNKDRKVGYGIFGTYQDKTNKNEKRIHINGVGEGAMWVCNKNGNVSNGSYITSSAVGGYGMKQESNQLLNSSVAKITCDCNFNLNPIVKQKVKVIENIKTLKKPKRIDYEVVNKEVKYDEETNQYREFEITKSYSKIEIEQFSVYDSNGEQLLDNKGKPRTFGVEVMEEYQVIETDLDFDENGNVQYEDDLDDNGQQQMKYEYDTRFLNSDGSIILTEEEYQNKKDSGENVYISCFVGCTYHCG
jgi:hypothetical protein